MGCAHRRRDTGLLDAGGACICVSGLAMPQGNADVAVVFGNALNRDGTPASILRRASKRHCNVIARGNVRCSS